MKNAIFSYPSGVSQPCGQLASMQNYITENCIASHLGNPALSFSLSNYCLVLCLSQSQGDPFIRQLQVLTGLLQVTSFNAAWKLLLYQPQLHYTYSVLARRSLKPVGQIAIFVSQQVTFTLKRSKKNLLRDSIK